MQISDKDETFLIIKFGADYQSSMIDSWDWDETVQFTDKEKEIVLNEYRIAAGLDPKLSK